MEKNLHKESKKTKIDLHISLFSSVPSQLAEKNYPIIDNNKLL